MDLSPGEVQSYKVLLTRKENKRTFESFHYNQNELLGKKSSHLI